VPPPLKTWTTNVFELGLTLVTLPRTVSGCPGTGIGVGVGGTRVGVAVGGGTTLVLVGVGASPPCGVAVGGRGNRSVAVLVAPSAGAGVLGCVSAV
jgi:hypothetical protein